MNWEQAIKQKVGSNKYPTLTRIKIGRGITAWALIPLNFSAWMLPIGAMLSIPLSPSVYAKSKIIDFKERWSLR